MKGAQFFTNFKIVQRECIFFHALNTFPPSSTLLNDRIPFSVENVMKVIAVTMPLFPQGAMRSFVVVVLGVAVEAALQFKNRGSHQPDAKAFQIVALPF